METTELINDIHNEIYKLEQRVDDIEESIEDSDGTPYGKLRSEVSKLRSRLSKLESTEEEVELTEEVRILEEKMNIPDFSEKPVSGETDQEEEKEQKQDLTNNQRELLDIAGDNPDLEWREIAELTGYNRGNAVKAVKEIRKKGYSLPKNLQEIG